MRQRADGKREPDSGIRAESLSGDGAVCAAALGGIWIFEPKAGHRTIAVYRMVIPAVSSGRHRNWLVDVSLFALSDRAHCNVQLER